MIGTAYCGSTLLGRALNCNSHMVYTGELSRLEGNYNTYGLDQAPAGCMECVIQNSKCHIFTDKIVSQTAIKQPRDFNQVIRKITKKSIIIDGSKHIEWLRIANKNNDNQDSVRVVILVKAPCEYLKSCLVRDIEPLWAEANAWRDTYFDAIRTVNQLGVSSLVVHYEDYIQDPTKTLKQICTYLGVGFEKRMLEPGKAQLHAIGGNPGAYADSIDKKVLSERASTLGQKEFDINPARLKTSLLTKLQKIRQGQKLRQIAFETPGLVDVATQLGYSYKDF